MTPHDTLARALIHAGLGGSAPYAAAHGLLLMLTTQAGGDQDHHARHAAQLLQAGPDLTDVLASCDEAAQMSILARLAYAGLSLEAILALLPQKERTV